MLDAGIRTQAATGVLNVHQSTLLDVCNNGTLPGLLKTGGEVDAPE